MTVTRPAFNPQRTNGTPAQQPIRPKLGRLGSAASVEAARIILNATEGFGKTTLGAYAPNPAILMSRGESGYITLRSKGLVPDADCVELSRWQDVLATVDDLSTGKYGSIVLDALGGFERLCHEFICSRDFGGDWGEKGFASFGKGPDVSLSEWITLLTKLDKVRQDRQIPIIVLSHSKVKAFKNPIGPDFDRYIADCNEKTWGVTHKWADAVLFGNFVTVALEDKKTKRMKGIGGDERMIYTTRRDAFDAKNRYGLAPQIEISDDPTAMWSTVWNTITAKPDSVATTDDSIPE